MILILGAIFFIAIVMLIAGLVEEVKGLWISALVLMGLVILAAGSVMFIGVTM